MPRLTHTAVHRRRLRTLANFLATKVPNRKTKFDMRYWTRGRTGNPQDCGTAGCAVGWSTTIPAFKKAGLHINFTAANKGDPQEFGELVFNNKTDWGAAEAFFGLSSSQCEALFWQGSYRNPTPKRVAKRIRAFLAGETITDQAIY